MWATSWSRLAKNGLAMWTICDTHALLFWTDQRQRLSQPAVAAMQAGLASQEVACAGISLWEIAMLFRKGRLALPQGHSTAQYLDDIVDALRLTILPITPDIAALAESGRIAHGDPADRLIAATAMVHGAKLVTADRELRRLPGLQCIW